MNKLIIGTIILLFMTGCATTSSIQRRLQDRTSELMYVHDSEKNVRKKGGTLQLGAFVVHDILPAEITVTRVSSSVYPFIVVNFWKQDLRSGLGYDQIKNDYKLFIKERLIEELKRSSKFTFGEQSGNLVLDVTVNKVEMAAPISQNGNFLFLLFIAAWGSRTAAGPVDVDIRADISLKKDENQIIKKELHGKYRTNVLSGRNLELGDYTSAMIEGLSLAIKDLHEKIVKEVNQI